MNKHSFLQLDILSPEEIQKLSEYSRNIGFIFGNVNKNLHNYDLFSQQIFGPNFDYICACGKQLKKKKKEKEINQFCTKCGVEFISKEIKLDRKGFIQLNFSIIHPFYLDYCKKILLITNEGIKNIIKLNTFKIFSSFFLWTHFLSEKKFISVFNLSLKKRYIHNNALISKFFAYNNLNKYKTSFNKKFNNNYNNLLFYGINYNKNWFLNEEFYQISSFFLDYNNKSLGKFKPYNYYNLREKFNKYKYILQNKNFIKGVYSFYKNEINNCNIQIGGDAIEIEFLQDILSFNIINFYLNKKIERIKNLLYNSFYENKYNSFFFEINNCLDYKSLINQFYLKKRVPVWMILRRIPVLSPDLRPILDLSGKGFQEKSNKGVLLSMKNIMQEGDTFISNINEFYKHIINRNIIYIYSNNINIYKLFKILKPDLILLQNAVFTFFDKDTLFSYNKLIKEFTDLLPKNFNTQSILDSLKGKYGQIRLNLLGKRVNYSGRSVITSAPDLNIYECGLPYEIIFTLFFPFICQKIKNSFFNLTKFQNNLNNLELFLYNNSKIFNKILYSIIQGFPVILNRAPTLHRLGIQSFIPKLSKGKNIELHPLVCSAFNADFDGDQMAIHLPLTETAQLESILLISSNLFIYSPASGLPIIMPAQDIILGSSFFTSNFLIKNFKNKSSIKLTKKEKLFSEYQEPFWMSTNHNIINKINKSFYFKYKNFKISIEFQINFEGILKNLIFNQYKLNSIIFDYFKEIKMSPLNIKFLLLNKKKLNLILFNFYKSKNQKLKNQHNYLRTTLGYLFFYNN